LEVDWFEWCVLVSIDEFEEIWFEFGGFVILEVVRDAQFYRWARERGLGVVLGFGVFGGRARWFAQ
jgi:hypothetical protein